MRSLGILGILALISCVVGCSHLHPVAQPPIRIHAQKLPTPNCQHVHILIIHGMDPFDFSNLKGFKQLCLQHGYAHTILENYYDFPTIEKQIVAIKQADPAAKIIFFGFSAGTISARDLANLAHVKYGIQTDLVFYVGGVFLSNDGYSNVPSAGKVINVIDDSCVLHTRSLANTENFRIHGTGHFDTCMHPQVVTKFFQEVDALASH